MLLVTFSGLDGCGKTTHTVRTVEFLRQNGYRVYQLATSRISAGGLIAMARAFWKRRPAEGPLPVEPTFQSAEQPRGNPNPHIHPRSHSNSSIHFAARGWRHRPGAARCWITYPLDCVALLFSIRVLSLLGYTAVVCDRYVYDKIVNLLDPNCRLVRLMRWISPKPDFAFLIDTAPDAARQRRDEHQADYYEGKCACYRRLTGATGELKTIPSTTIAQTQRRLENVLSKSILHGPPAVAIETT